MSARRPVIGIMGAAAPTSASLSAARELGRLVAERGWIVLTGGRPAGIMAAASAGAKEISGSLTLGVLPDAGGGAGPDVDIAVYTGMGDARNAINVLTSDAIVACGVEGPGTASEVALALKAGKPVILLGATEASRNFFGELPRAGILRSVDTPQNAIEILEQELRLTQVGRS